MSYQEDTQHRCTVEDEISLIDLFLIVWKRKWMIVAVTLLITIGAAGISFILPEVYAITAIMEPAKDANGRPVKDPQNLRETINAGVFNAAIAQNLDIPAEAVPQLKVATPKNTSLVKISVESPDAERAVAIVEEALQLITADIQKSSFPLIMKIQERIEGFELEEDRLLEQIELTAKQLEQVEKTILTLESERKEDLANSLDRAIAVLLYANELQNQRNYAYDLREKLTDLMIKKEEISIAKNNIQQELEGVESTFIHAQPSVPKHPVKPKKPLIIALAFVLGFLGSIMLAFLGEFIHSVRRQQQQNEA